MHHDCTPNYAVRWDSIPCMYFAESTCRCFRPANCFLQFHDGVVSDASPRARNDRTSDRAHAPCLQDRGHVARTSARLMCGFCIGGSMSPLLTILLMMKATYSVLYQSVNITIGSCRRRARKLPVSRKLRLPAVTMIGGPSHPPRPHLSQPQADRPD